MAPFSLTICLSGSGATRGALSFRLKRADIEAGIRKGGEDEEFWKPLDAITRLCEALHSKGCDQVLQPSLIVA
jgi:hypothetical protein